MYYLLLEPFIFVGKIVNSVYLRVQMNVHDAVRILNINR